MLKIENVCKDYFVKGKKGKKTKVEALKNVSITFEDNNNYCLVGESGSGKSTLSKVIMGIEKPTSGEILYNNKNIANINKSELRAIRNEIQMVFQDSCSALDPRMTIYNSIAEPIRNFEKLGKNKEKEKVEELAKKVELEIDCLNKFPSQLSGGQQQRVCIARAIAMQPNLIVFDESVSGLDVTVRKKILDLILKLREDTKSTFIFITHDLEVAMYMSNNIAVMKGGEIVEYSNNLKSLNDLESEYSKVLISSLAPKYPEKQYLRKVI